MIRKKTDLIIITIFLSLYLVGLVIYSDYGLTLDDEYYRLNGVFFFEYIKEFIFNQNFNANNINIYKNVNMSIAPVFYDLLIAFIANIFNIVNINQIYKVSHLVNFTIYFISLIFFFRILKKLLNDNYLSLLGILMLFLTPRIFAESFYNTRDIFFMSLFLMNIYFSLKVLEKNNFQNILILSIFSGLLISTKIFGIIPFILIIFLIIMEKIKNDKLPLKELKNIIYLIFLCIFFIFIFSPYMWKNPFINFYLFFSEAIFSQQQIDVTNLFLGELYNSNNSPWFFRPLWFLITTPIMIIFLSMLGMFFYLVKLFQSMLSLKNNENPWKNKEELFDIFLFLNIVLSIFSILYFNNSNLDGWRHLYFLYPLLIYFSLSLFLNFNKIFNFNIKRLLISLVLINLTYTGFWMYKNHPHQQVYFNIISKNYINKNFDLDYWGLSNYQSFLYILKNEKNFPVTISTISFSSLEANTIYLSKENKSKIKISYDFKNSDFIIDNYRPNLRIDKNEVLKNYDLYYEIIVDENKINSIYKKK